MKIIIIFIAVVVVKILINTFRYFTTKYYYIIFLEYIERKTSSNICRCIPPVSRLFEEAGTQRTVVVHIDHNFYSTEISTQLNNRYYKDDIIEIFETTLGVYAQRIRESVYPMYWLNLPLSALEKLNFEIPSVIKFPLKIISWSVGVASAYFLEKFLDSSFVSEKIQEFLHIL